MIGRREFIALLGGATAAASFFCLRTGHAQPTSKVSSTEFQENDHEN
jgi:hypothetical protein